MENPTQIPHNALWLWIKLHIKPFRIAIERENSLFAHQFYRIKWFLMALCSSNEMNSGVLKELIGVKLKEDGKIIREKLQKSSFEGVFLGFLNEP